jgi:hypothetical protein
MFRHVFSVKVLTAFEQPALSIKDVEAFGFTVLVLARRQVGQENAKETQGGKPHSHPLRRRRCRTTKPEPKMVSSAMG